MGGVRIMVDDVRLTFYFAIEVSVKIDLGEPRVLHHVIRSSSLSSYTKDVNKKQRLKWEERS